MTWRTRTLEQLGDFLADTDETLTCLDNLHAIHEYRGRDKVCQQIRSLQASLRSETVDIRDELKQVQVAVDEHERETAALKGLS